MLPLRLGQCAAEPGSFVPGGPAEKMVRYLQLIVSASELVSLAADRPRSGKQLMSNNPARRGLETSRSPSVGNDREWGARIWPAIVTLAAALLGLWLARLVARSAADPTLNRTRLSTLLIAAASLIVMGVQVRRLVLLTQSRQRHVFAARHVFTCGVFLTAVAVALVVGSVMAVDPFRQFLAGGRLGATDIADAAWMAAPLIPATGAVTALVASWDARREELDWGDVTRRGR